MLGKLFVVLFAALLANAQTSGTTVSPCILGCIVPAAAQNGCSFTDATCVCASAQFQSDARGCLLAHCTPQEYQTALALQAADCTAAGISASGTPATHSVAFTLPGNSGSSSTSAGGVSTTAPPASSSTNSSPSSSANTNAPSTTPSSAASSLIALGGANAVIGVVLAGVLAF